MVQGVLNRGFDLFPREEAHIALDLCHASPLLEVAGDLFHGNAGVQDAGEARLVAGPAHDERVLREHIAGQAGSESPLEIGSRAPHRQWQDRYCTTSRGNQATSLQVVPGRLDLIGAHTYRRRHICKVWRLDSFLWHMCCILTTQRQPLHVSRLYHAMSCLPLCASLTRQEHAWKCLPEWRDTCDGLCHSSSLHLSS